MSLTKHPPVLTRLRIVGSIRQGEFYTAQIGSFVYTWNATEANRLAYESFQRGEGMTGGRWGKFCLTVITPASKKAIEASGLHVNEEHLASDSCDPERPIIGIISPEDGLEYIIDGNHRMLKALRWGWKELPEFLLSP